MRTNFGLISAVGLVLASFSQSALGAGIEIVNTSGAAGSTVSVQVKLTSDADLVVGVQNDIKFDPTKVSVQAVAANDNKPNCTVNEAINKKIDGSLTFGFGFLKDGVACDGTSGTCDTIRAIVLSTDNVDNIAAGSVLYTCQFTIAGSATGTIDLTSRVTEENVIASDSAGQRLSGFTSGSGVITVGAGLCVGACNPSAPSCVTLADLRISVNVFTGAASPTTCPSVDTGDLAKLRQAVNNFVAGGCGSCN